MRTIIWGRSLEMPCQDLFSHPSLRTGCGGRYPTSTAGRPLRVRHRIRLSYKRIHEWKPQTRPMQSAVARQHRHKDQADGTSLLDPRPRCHCSHVRKFPNCLTLILDLTLAFCWFTGEACAISRRHSVSDQRLFLLHLVF